MPDGSPARLVTIFGSLDADGGRRVHYVFDTGDADYRALAVSGDGPVPSLVPQLPAAAWHEREVRDQYGIEFTGHPDFRPLLFHENWPDGVYPMIHAVDNVPVATREYRFLEVQGEGISEVAVGPVHAGIIEPGHFRFSVVGDTVLHLELRHFYTHKGTEKLFQGCPIEAGPMIAESVSGDNCFSHAVAYCQAVETACGVTPPPRAAALRLVGLELERLVAHVGDFGALCNDVAFSVPAASAAGIKESLLQASARFAGTRYWRGIAVPGGLRVDFGDGAAEFLAAVETAAREFAALAAAVMETPSVQDRFDFTGVLKRDVARDLAVVGLVARACGIAMDVRRDHPSGLYRDLTVEVPFVRYGDVRARARMRMEEAAVSAGLIREAVERLAPGPVCAPAAALAPPPAAERSGPPPGTERSGPQRVQGWSAVESPRGELFYWVEVAAGLLARCHVRSPSFQNWPALPFAVVDNIIADFPLVNKSFNLSYSGCDR